jgi:hypothetical protein
MIDFFHFETPYGSLGKVANKLLLTRYLKILLENRNKVIKLYAETNMWKGILQDEATR